MSNEKTQPEADNEDEVVAEDTTEEVDVEDDEEDTEDTDENPKESSPYRY